MFKISSIYKHVNCLDICFKIHSIKQEENGDIELKGLWLNQHYDMIPICEDVIVVTKDRVRQWKEIN
jgi:hypothetical protein